MKYCLSILLLALVLSATSQRTFRIELSNSTLAAADSVMPFWLQANRHGKVQPAGSWLNLSDLYLGQSWRTSGTAPDYTWGANGVAGFGERSYFQLNQAFAGVSYRGWALTAGLFHDSTYYSGLSTTNGNLARSRNARPHPRLRFATRGYKPVPFLDSWLSFRAEYEEGLLNDERYVEGAHLHHKSFYLRVSLPRQWELEGGLEHFVMWGGTSRNENIGRLPAGPKAYLHYVLGKSGSDEFPLTDRLNVAGNQLGTYQFRASKMFAAGKATFYLSHPFEDLSGMNWRNWPDNLLGLHFRFNDNSRLITGVLYEFTNTRQQSIRGGWDRQEPDSYYNHGVYRSGYTYDGQMMGSPLFFPVVITDGIARGIRSNQLVAHHVGVRGMLSDHLAWKGMLTRVQHEGAYFSPYSPVQRQLSALLEINYANPRLPVGLGLSAAADNNSATGRNLGVMFSVSKTVMFR